MCEWKQPNTEVVLQTDGNEEGRTRAASLFVCEGVFFSSNLDNAVIIVVQTELMATFPQWSDPRARVNQRLFWSQQNSRIICFRFHIMVYLLICLSPPVSFDCVQETTGGLLSLCVSHSSPHLYPSLRERSRNGFHSLAEMRAAWRSDKNAFFPWFSKCVTWWKMGRKMKKRRRKEKTLSSIFNERQWEELSRFVSHCSTTTWLLPDDDGTTS